MATGTATSAIKDTIAAGKFKAKCLKLLDEVAESRQPLTITKHGKPVAAGFDTGGAGGPVRRIEGKCDLGR